MTEDNKLITIYETSDDHDCEVCGSTWETSYHTTFEGHEIGKQALASCFGSESSTEFDVLVGVLDKLGYRVEIVREDCEDGYVEYLEDY